MISLTQLQDYMTKQLEEDRKVKSLRIEGENIEEALRQASIELGVPVKKLEYEVVEQGRKGTLGIGKKNWVLLVYEMVQEAAAPGFDEIGMDELEFAGDFAPGEDKPGIVFVKLTHDGAFLKVTPPVGHGARASERDALQRVALRGVNQYDAKTVAKVVKRAEGEYIKIGDFDFNPNNQATLSVETAEQEMKAYIHVTQPGPGGPDLTKEEIISLLQSNGVIFGIKEEDIDNFIDYPQYNTQVLAAEGRKVVDGEDAHIVYNFAINHSHIVLKEKNGRVDFKEQNLIENVEAGQVLAKKVVLQQGEPGSTVTGRSLAANPGKDIELELGKNVKLSDDGLTVIAVINGQVLLTSGKINVEPVYTVEGDVNMHTGNILFLGTVIVKGSVGSGFTVKAAGNIEVMGSVGRSFLDAEGDIIVHQGIMGKNEGRVKAGINVVAKFIEHARIEAEENVVVSDGIIHSVVDANMRILCQGKRASIVGGKLRAGEEINAKVLGSVAGTETILEVGFDPKSKERLMELFKTKEEIENELQEVELNINTITNLQKVQRKISEEKAKSLEDLNNKRAEMLTELEEIAKEINSINEYLGGLKIKGKVSASGKVFPGVKIFIKNEHLVVRNEFNKVTFILQGKEVRMTKYEPVEEGIAGSE